MRAIGRTTAFLILALASVAAPTLSDVGPPEVTTAVRHDLSPPLRELARRPAPPPSGLNREIPIHRPPDLATRHRGAVEAPDATVQLEARPDPRLAPTPSPDLVFDGTTDADNLSVNGFVVVPPDTEGDVGPSHYVQMNNLVFEIFDKNGGSILGPVANSSLWAGFGGICETNNDGDPIVLYDHLADRWVMSQFAIGSTGHQCVAVSTTGDPTGSYFRYDFEVSPDPGGFNDYPKLGVWEDAYYLTVNEFIGAPFNGAIAVAFERAKMLAGQTARMIRQGPLACATECFFSLQPSHLEGPPPAAGTPNPFIMVFDDETWGTGSGPDGYRLWNFSVDWTQAPPASSFTPLPHVGGAEFDAELCAFSPTCVPQPPPGELLDTLAAFTMYRAQYRHFPDHDSILINQTADAGSNRAGVRWAELRNSGSGWSVYQERTYAPNDGLHRWMGSLAMDGEGNLCVGYSASSASQFPSIRYACREATDPLGELPGGEVVMKAGTGAQITSSNRWGDYSAMSIDPADDCTFWYTSEYYQTTSSFNFKTSIGKFRFPGCESTPGISFFDDFEDGILATNWDFQRGETWEESGGSMNGTPDDNVGFQIKARAIADPAFGGCDVCSVVATYEGTDIDPAATPAMVGLRILAWYVDKPTNVAVTLKPEQDKLVFRQKENKVTMERIAIDTPLDPDQVYVVRLDFDGFNFQIYLDGVLIINTPSQFSTAPFGTIGFQSRSSVMKAHEIAVSPY